MPAFDTLLTGGAGATLVAVVLYGGRLLLDWHHERRMEHREDRTAAGADDASTRATLLDMLNVARESLRDEREEVARLSGRVEDLETQNALLYERMRDQRREYEREIGGLRKQLDDLTTKLDDLQRRWQEPPTLP